MRFSKGRKCSKKASVPTGFTIARKPAAWDVRLRTPCRLFFARSERATRALDPFSACWNAYATSMGAISGSAPQASATVACPVGRSSGMVTQPEHLAGAIGKRRAALAEHGVVGNHQVERAISARVRFRHDQRLLPGDHQQRQPVGGHRTGKIDPFDDLQLVREVLHLPGDRWREIRRTHRRRALGRSRTQRSNASANDVPWLNSV